VYSEVKEGVDHKQGERLGCFGRVRDGDQTLWLQQLTNKHTYATTAVLPHVGNSLLRLILPKPLAALVRMFLPLAATAEPAHLGFGHIASPRSLHKFLT
jgi:hypothetical protein